MPSSKEDLDARRKDAADIVVDMANATKNVTTGTKAGCSGFRVVTESMSSAKACKVNILTNAGRNSKPILRFDAAHIKYANPKVHVPHVNLNRYVNTWLPKNAKGVRIDPHWAIPGGEAGLNGAQKAAKFCKTANKVVLPIAIAVDAVQGGMAIASDVKHKTSRNTVEKGASIAGGWGGGYGGAALGASIGSALFPGVGTLVGGIIGGIAGGVGGSIGAEKLTECISDGLDYDIEEAPEPCRKCKKRYKYRKYVREDDGICDECRK